ncbi:MAG TPA: hypothetical protein VGK61_03665 [Planctomycetota bacterium]|jgi:predicted DNA-binding protein
MAKETLISAMVSCDIKERLDRLVLATGVKKSHVIEMALRHHLQALLELPTAVIISPRVVVTRESGDELARRIRSPRKASRELRDLMAEDGG